MQQIQVLLFGTSGIFFICLFLNIFNLQLVESVDVEPMDMES